MKLNRTASLFLSIALLASVVVGYSTTANAAGNPNCNAVDGDYIISFAPGVSVDKEIKAAPGRAINAKFKYDKALNGFAASLSAEQACAFQKRPNIESIELDGVVTSEAVSSWGLDRVDQTALPLDQSYSFTSSGVGVTAYVIDTGILLAHNEFSGRATWGTNTTGDAQDTDCNGHGTHVSGTIGGNTFGIAKSVDLVAVKVLGCNGSGSWSGVIAGINWVIGNHTTSKAVANMSLGGSASTSIDTAITNLVNDGVVTVVAAGNDGRDACKSSPARAPKAITVAASDSTDRLASFSNYGKCVDVIAPGVAITSSVNSSLTASATWNGTSMASPHVAGVVARFLQNNAWTTIGSIPSTLFTSNKIALTGSAKSSGMPNKLIYMASTN
jgi:subtilisin family serine protease